MARARKSVQKEFNEKQFAKDLKVVRQILAAYSLELESEIRFRRITDGDGGTWCSAKVIGINKDMSILCIEEGRFRSIMPGRVFEVQTKTKGPRGGIVWVDVTTSPDAV